MKIGICSTDFRPTSVDALFEKMRALCFTATQFSFNSVLGSEEMLPEYNEELLAEIDCAAKKHAVEIVAINATFNMLDPIDARREENIRRMDVMCRAARRLGCPILTLCTGSRNPDSGWVWHEDNSKPESWALMISVMRRLVAYAEQYDLTLVVETEAANVVQTPQLARKMLDEIGSPHLKMVIDCANLFLPGTAHRENAVATIQSAFDVFGAEIALAHGKDIADSDGIEFAPVGTGIVDYDLFLRLLYQYGYRGALIEHGIYKENLMPACVDFLSEKIKSSQYDLEE